MARVFIRFLKIFAIFLVIEFFTLTSINTVSAVEEIKLPPPQGYVNDFANIIDNDEALEAKLAKFEKETTNELFVLTVDSLQGYSIDEFTIRLREQDKWKIGKKDKDNGILLVVAPNERRVRIDVGYGLEAVLPPSKAGMIIEKTIKPYFKNKQYSDGINAGVDEIIKVVLEGQSFEGKEEVSTQKTKSTTLQVFENIIIPLVCFGALVPFFFLGLTPFIPTIFRKIPGYWVGGIMGGLIGIGLSLFFYSEMGWWALLNFPLAIGAGILADMIAETESSGGKTSRWYARSFGGGFSGGGGSSGGSGASSGW